MAVFRIEIHHKEEPMEAWYVNDWGFGAFFTHTESENTRLRVERAENMLMLAPPFCRVEELHHPMPQPAIGNGGFAVAAAQADAHEAQIEAHRRMLAQLGAPNWLVHQHNAQNMQNMAMQNQYAQNQAMANQNMNAQRNPHDPYRGQMIPGTQFVQYQAAAAAERPQRVWWTRLNNPFNWNGE